MISLSFIRAITIRRRVFVFPITLFLLMWSMPAQASMGGQIDYSNDRIVPVFDKLRDGVASYSAFLYAPRILFTAAHSPLFVGNYAGLPNSKADGTGPKVKIIKKILAPTFKSENLINDFAIFILEKDLVAVDPFPLMTPEIERELLRINSTVQTHGYGIYNVALGCASGNFTACSDDLRRKSIEPRMVELKAYTAAQMSTLTKWNLSDLPFRDHFLMFTGSIAGGCSGDSGGSITAVYQGVTYYVGPTPNGARVYACGMGGSDGTNGVHFSSQVYKHLDILKEAENFVKAAYEQEKLNSAVAQVKPKTKTIVCIKDSKSKKVTAVWPKCPSGFKRKK